MRAMSKREKVLLGVLVVGGAVAYFGFGPDGFGLGVGEDPGRKAKLGPLGEPPLVDTDLLVRNAPGYDPQGRDLFQYYTPPPPRIERPPQEEIPRPVVPPPPPPPPPPPRIERPRVEPPPQPEFKFLGLIGPKDSPIGVFETGEERVNKGVGEVIETQFRLLEFKFEAVVLGFVDEKWAGKTVELKQEGT